MQPLNNIKENDETNLNEENTKKEKRNSFERCHMIYDATSLAITIALTITGAICIDANLPGKINPLLFSLVITEMLIFGLILKSTYYLYVHPWEKLNRRHSKYVKAHGVITVLFIIGFFITVYCFGVTSIKILSICILVLLMPIGSVSFYNFFLINYILMSEQQQLLKFGRPKSNSSLNKDKENLVLEL